MSSVKQIEMLEKKRARILKEIYNFRLMLPGAYKEVYCKCGKQNCWCQHTEGHPYRRITWTEKGSSKTKAIPGIDINWIKEVTENYRKFRKKIKELNDLNENFRALLYEYGANVIIETRKLKDYL